MSQAFLTFGDWTVRPAERAIEQPGHRITLEPRLMDVLVYLALHADEVTSAEALLAACWPGEAYGDNPVHKCIAMLRKALGDDARAPRYIATIRKRGYRVVAQVAFADGGQHAGCRTGYRQGDSPYPGQRPFAVEDAALFFGRRHLRAGLLIALRQANDRRFPMVIVSGPVGCGVTSLVQAGVAPALLREAGYDGMRAVAHARLAPRGLRGNGLVALAAAMCEWRIQGEAIFVNTERDALAHALLGDLELILGRIRARLQDTGGLLLLMADALDSIVASDDPDSARAVIRALSLMAASGSVAVLATCRQGMSDRIAGFMAQTQDGGRPRDFMVGFPGTGELANMVRQPAALACLSFEEHAVSERRLDDQILEDAQHAAWSLSSLQGVLHSLFQLREAEGRLTFAGYRQAAEARRDARLSPALPCRG